MKKIAIYLSLIINLLAFDSPQLGKVSLSFDGKDDCVSFLNPIDLSGKDKVTFSVWIRINEKMPTGHQNIFRQDKNGVPDFYIGFDGKGIFEFALRTADGYKELEVTAGDFSEWNNWVHVVGTYDGTSQKLYKNGSEVGNTNATGNVSFGSDKPFALGCRDFGELFHGSIDEFVIWDAALTPSEIEALYTTGNGVAASNNLKGYWSINEGTGDKIIDSSTNSNNGTINGASWASDGVLSVLNEINLTSFALHENYPNPFNPATTLRFDLPEVSDVNVVIYNMLGQKVRTFNMNSISAGSHSIKWNATNDLGDPVGAGVYLYKLQAKDFVKTRKMILLK